MVSRTTKIVAIISLIVAIIVGIVTVESIQPSIDYYLENPQNLYFVRGLNHVTAYCKNGGGSDGNFNLVFTMMNATFSNQTAFPYEYVSNSTVKFSFVLHKGDQNNKLIYFFVDNATTEFSLTLTAEGTSFFQFLKGNGMYPTQLAYQWNETSHSFSYASPT
jgi:hypothetical protein